MTTYTKEWFAAQVGTAQQSAATLVPMILDFAKPTSVLDIGCGLGAWLAEFKTRGVTDVQGVDGDYIDVTSLRIPKSEFLALDISQPVSLGRRFGLALCLEVGEHLPEAAAGTLVKSLTDHAPIVAFSAAIPGQGGNHHINEQWQSYWAAKFAARGYRAVDAFRGTIWNNPSVEWWYRQNLLMYATEETLQANPRLREIADRTPTGVLDAVHPVLFGAAHERAAHPGRAVAQYFYLGFRSMARRMVGK